MKISERTTVMRLYHRLENLQFKGTALHREISPKLVGASEGRNNFEISPSGYGIYWPLLNDDRSVDGLFGIVHTPNFQEKRA